MYTNHETLTPCLCPFTSSILKPVSRRRVTLSFDLTLRGKGALLFSPGFKVREAGFRKLTTHRIWSFLLGPNN